MPRGTPHEEYTKINSSYLYLINEVQNDCKKNVRLTNAANKAVGLHVILDALQLVTELTKGVNDQTLDDGKQDDDDKEEEGDVKYDAVDLIVIPVW
jgi:hypothetical protein